VDATILIVEAEEATRRSMVRILERRGYECVEAVDGDEARAAIDLRVFDLILCDVNMPGHSGLDLVEGVLTDTPQTAVVIVTGIDDPEIADLALEAGVYGYILKPFTPNELLINIANALRRGRLEAESRADKEQLIEAVRDRTGDLWKAVRRLEHADDKARSSIEEMLRKISLAAEPRDMETALHIQTMSRYSETLARKLGLGSERSAQILLASRLHDVGKIGIPDRILRKKGSFTPREYEIMKQHSEIGHKLLGGTDAELLQLAAIVAWTHHERWDGSGYPEGLTGDAIPLEGRIVAVADCFDALMTKRSYRPKLPFDQVIAFMRESRCTRFDPVVLDAFLDSLDEILTIAQQPEE
jgi:putative two-component system response regulator